MNTGFGGGERSGSRFALTVELESMIFADPLNLVIVFLYKVLDLEMWRQWKGTGWTANVNTCKRALVLTKDSLGH